MKARSPIKYPGGKTFIADEIVELMKSAPHRHYVEPYFGGGSVFFSRPAYKWDGEEVGCSSVINDLDEHLHALWRVMTDPKLFAKFRNNVDMLQFSKKTFEYACEQLETMDDQLSLVKQATYFWAKNRMSRGGAGKCFATPVRSRLRGQVQDHVYSYLSAVDRLPEFHAMLKDAMVEGEDALTIITREDTPMTLFYCDPPYLDVPQRHVRSLPWQMEQEGRAGQEASQWLAGEAGGHRETVLQLRGEKR
jgi:DNA adenine methylase